VVGPADDAVLLSLELRSVTRRAGVDGASSQARHTAGLQALGRVTGLDLRAPSESRLAAAG
jgi:hypothetical protein